MRYQNDPTKNGWESDYRIINFGGFVFLKGITSWPKLVERIEKEKLVCLELENRKPVRHLELRIVK